MKTICQKTKDPVPTFFTDHNAVDLVRCIDPLIDTLKMFKPRRRKSWIPKPKTKSILYRQTNYTTKRLLTDAQCELIEGDKRFIKLRQKWWDFRAELKRKGKWTGNSPEMRLKRLANKRMMKVLRENNMNYFDCPLP